MPSEFSPIGINCSASNDSQPFHYINLIKSARPFGSKEKPWDQAGGPVVTATGHPTGDFGFVAWAGSTHWPGQYQLYTTGRVNKLTFSGSTVAPHQSEITNVYDSNLNVSRVYIQLPSLDVSGNTQFFIGVDYDETTIPEGIKELKFLRPGYTSDDDIFTKEYCRSLEPFGLVRLMQLLQTNHSVVTGENNRTKLSDCRWVDRGCPFEAVLRLMELTGKVPWFNFYHLLDDSAVRQVFELFKGYCTGRGLPFYFEDSNEAWNFGFQQGTYYYEEAKRQLAAGDPNGIGTPIGGTAPDELGRHRLHGLRLYRLAAIGREVFGSSSYLLRPILGGQAVSPWQLGVVIMDWLAEKYGPVKNWLYGTCITNYFGGGSDVLKQPGLTPQQVLAVLDAQAGKQADTANFKSHREHAQRHGVVLTGYEVGPDTTKSKNSVDAKITAVSSPEMSAIYSRHLQTMWDAGVQEVCGFDGCSKPGPEGTYGHTFDIRQLDTPKRKALGSFAAGKRLPAPLPPEKPVEEVRNLLTTAGASAAEAEKLMHDAAGKLEEVQVLLNDALKLLE